MIHPKIIQQKARKAQVRDTQIEKDYVLSWVLHGISQQANLCTLKIRFQVNSNMI